MPVRTQSLARATHLAPRALAVAAVVRATACQQPVRVATPAPAPGDSTADSTVVVLEPERATANRATSREWKDRQVTRVEELLIGRFPGVQVYQTNGGISVRVRGQNSILGSNEPLYVIDGMPVESGPNGLIAINPNDVASIEVLKDPASTSMYGLRGANGVVVIKTKRGP